MDFMYSDLGQLIQNYGPENYWAVLDEDLDAPQVTAELVADESNAIISDYTRLEFASSQVDFWSFMRGYVGATHGVGYVRLSGLNLQVTNTYGRVGLENIMKAIESDALIHAMVNAQDSENASKYTWTTSVPTDFQTSVTDTEGLWDGITGFWQANKVNKNEGWVNLIVTPYKANDTASLISLGKDEERFVVKTAKNGSKITYAKMYLQMDDMNRKCLWTLAKSLDDACVPSYASN
jgi:hypothetical protein